MSSNSHDVLKKTPQGLLSDQTNQMNTGECIQNISKNSHNVSNNSTHVAEKDYIPFPTYTLDVHLNF